MRNLEISVVIPTHNRRALLEEMLLALGRQTYPPRRFEVVVVNDGGRDDTPEMLEGLETPYRLRHLYQESAGVASARNRGAGLARAPVLVFLDDDLLPQPQLLEEHAQFHGRDPQAVVLGRLLPAERGDKAAGRKGGWNIWEERVLAQHYRAMAEGRRPPAGRRLYSGNFSVRAPHFQSVGGFDVELPRGEDIQLGFRLERRGLRFYFSPRAGAVHRGYRSFKSWCNSAYLYGRTDVRLSTQQGFPVLPELFGWYYRQPGAARRTVDLLCDRPPWHRVAVWGLRASAGILTTLGAHSLAHLGYSGVYKLQYWQGVADELGGMESFHQAARRWRLAAPVEDPAH
jgi:glycosyltransferase involved in cell wall biosynthesis